MNNALKPVVALGLLATWSVGNADPVQATMTNDVTLYNVHIFWINNDPQFPYPDQVNWNGPFAPGTHTLDFDPNPVDFQFGFAAIANITSTQDVVLGFYNANTSGGPIGQTWEQFFGSGNGEPTEADVFAMIQNNQTNDLGAFLSNYGLIGQHPMDLVMFSAGSDQGDIAFAPVPEPMTLSLAVVGGLALLRRRRS